MEFSSVPYVQKICILSTSCCNSVDLEKPALGRIDRSIKLSIVCAHTVDYLVIIGTFPAVSMTVLRAECPDLCRWCWPVRHERSIWIHRSLLSIISVFRHRLYQDHSRRSKCCCWSFLASSDIMLLSVYQSHFQDLGPLNFSTVVATFWENK